MKTQQDWMDFFNKRNVTTNILSMPAARVSLSACDIWDIQSDAVEDLKAERDELRGVIWEMLHHFGNPKRGEWLNAEGFAAAKAVDDKARAIIGNVWHAKERKEGLH